MSTRTTMEIILWCASRWPSARTRTGFAGICGSRGSRASARAEDLPEESSVRIDIPGYVAPDRIRALLDTGRALSREAGAALEKPPPIDEAQYAVRLWWSEQGR